MTVVRGSLPTLCSVVLRNNIRFWYHLCYRFSSNLIYRLLFGFSCLFYGVIQRRTRDRYTRSRIIGPRNRIETKPSDRDGRLVLFGFDVLLLHLFVCTAGV